MAATSTNPLATLARLERQSRDHSFQLDDVDWSVAADRRLPWMPDTIGALAFLPSYRLLTAGERLRCNQLQALGVAEQFVWAEGLVIRALARALTGRLRLPAELRRALSQFAEEEDKHVAMFGRLLERSEPAWYPAPHPRFFALSPPERWLMEGVADHPDVMLMWIWFTIFVEERTLFLSREFARARRRSPEAIDPLHAHVHALHLRDEARHVQLDEHLLAHAYDAQPAWKRALCGRMFAQVARAHTAPHRIARSILGVLEREFPRLRAAVAPQLRAELPGLRDDLRFRRRVLGRDAMPRTFALLAAYPEHRRTLALLAEPPQDDHEVCHGHA